MTALPGSSPTVFVYKKGSVQRSEEVKQPKTPRCGLGLTDSTAGLRFWLKLQRLTHNAMESGGKTRYGYYNRKQITPHTPLQEGNHGKERIGHTSLTRSSATCAGPGRGAPAALWPQAQAHQRSGRSGGTQHPVGPSLALAAPARPSPEGGPEAPRRPCWTRWSSWPPRRNCSTAR